MNNKDFMSQKDEVYKIGEEITKCDWQCEGMCKNRAAGILPRGLYLETRSGSKSVIILGLNPGPADDEERKYFQEFGDSYYHKEKYFFDRYFNLPFYKYSREFADAIGYDGDILWTELVKCESLQGSKKIPKNTIQFCTKKFLLKELASMSKIPIIALGNDAYYFCVNEAPDRFVIGVPHPTGAWQQLKNLNKKIKLSPDYYMDMLSKGELVKDKIKINNKVIIIIRKTK